MLAVCAPAGAADQLRSAAEIVISHRGILSRTPERDAARADGNRRRGVAVAILEVESGARAAGCDYAQQNPFPRPAAGSGAPCVGCGSPSRWSFDHLIDEAPGPHAAIRRGYVNLEPAGHIVRLDAVCGGDAFLVCDYGQSLGAIR